MQKVTISSVTSVCPFVCPHGTTQLPLDGFSKNFIFGNFSKICQENSSFFNLTEIIITLHKNPNTLLITSRSCLLRMKNVSDKCCREKQNTHFSFNKVFENRAIYKTKWKNTVQPGRPQKIIWHMRIACWIPKAAITHS